MFNISRYAIDNRAIVRLMILVIVLGGIYSFLVLGKREDSTFTIKSAVITCTYPGAEPEVVEKLVTEPLERELRTLQHVDEISSESHFGYARLVVKLEPKTRAKQVPQIWDELRSKVDNIRPTLPKELTSINIADDFGDVYGLYYALTADDGSFTWDELRNNALYIQNELYRIDGVEKVTLSGEQEAEIAITISPATLASFDIRPTEIKQAIESASATIALGTHSSNEITIVLSEGTPYITIDNIKNQLLTANDGKQYRLGDIATIEHRYHKPQRYIAQHNGNNAIGIAVATNPEEDVVAIGKRVEERLDELASRLPAGMMVATIYAENQIAKEATNDFLINLAESLVIVILLIILTMGWRSGIIVGSSLILSIGATLLIMLGLGESLNRTSLAGFIIAMGMLVDNAIVVTDNTSQLIRSGLPRRVAAIKAATKPSMGLLAATLIAIISFLPLQLSPSSVAEIIKPLFSVIAISLIISWLLALTQVPEMATRILRPSSIRKQKAERSIWFMPIIEMFIRNRWVVLTVTILLFCLSLATIAKMPQNFFPKLSKPMFRADVILAEGYDIDATEQRLASITSWLMSQPEVKQVSTTAGGTPPRYYLASGSYSNKPNYGNILIALHSEEGIEQVEQRLNDWVGENMPDVWLRSSLFKLSPVPDATIEFGFVGENIDTLSRLTEQAMAIMSNNANATNIRNSWGNRVPIYTPLYSQLKGQRLGINRLNMSEGVKMATDGVVVGNMRDGDRELNILLRTELLEQGSLEALSTMPVFSTKGRAYSMEQAADGFVFDFGPPVIKRIDSRRVMKAQCDPKLGVNTIELYESLNRAISEQITIPDGYRMEIYGEQESREESNKALGARLPITLILIVILLVMLLRNYRDMAIIVATIPLIFIGVVVGLVLSDKMFDFFSLLGLLGLVGMHVKSGVILIQRISELRREGYTVIESATKAATDRLTPVITASGTTVLALIPLLFDPMFGSMAATIMGGLVVATLLVVVIIPVTYIIFYK
ncbi:MAG: efflux RND transporter permease subunit [Alistipes sp.]|nr:efflux RND transporter permease subunit [Alistipes sp.]